MDPQSLRYTFYFIQRWRLLVHSPAPIRLTIFLTLECSQENSWNNDQLSIQIGPLEQDIWILQIFGNFVDVRSLRVLFVCD